jgi:hypothetical protein
VVSLLIPLRPNQLRALSRASLDELNCVDDAKETTRRDATRFEVSDRQLHQWVCQHGVWDAYARTWSSTPYRIGIAGACVHARPLDARSGTWALSSPCGPGTNARMRSRTLTLATGVLRCREPGNWWNSSRIPVGTVLSPLDNRNQTCLALSLEQPFTYMMASRTLSGVIRQLWKSVASRGLSTQGWCFRQVHELVPLLASLRQVRLHALCSAQINVAPPPPSLVDPLTETGWRRGGSFGSVSGTGARSA